MSAADGLGRSRGGWRPARRYGPARAGRGVGGPGPASKKRRAVICGSAMTSAARQTLAVGTCAVWVCATSAARVAERAHSRRRASIRSRASRRMAVSRTTASAAQSSSPTMRKSEAQCLGSMARRTPSHRRLPSCRPGRAPPCRGRRSGRPAARRRWAAWAGAPAAPACRTRRGAAARRAHGPARRSRPRARRRRRPRGLA